MIDRTWMLGDTSVDELYEYKNPGVIENYAGSFSTNIDDNTEKIRKKAGMLFPADLNHNIQNLSSCVCEVLKASLLTSSLICL